MIKAEDKTIECISCGRIVVLSGYNTTICPACGTSNYELDQGMLVLKNWIDRLRAEGKNPDDYIDKLGSLLRLSDLKEQRVVSLDEWKKLTAVFRDAEAQVSPNKEETQ